MITSKEKTDSRKLPMMPIRDVVIFPHMMTPFVVGRESSVRALEEALAGDRKIFLATQHDAKVDEPRPDEIFSTGTIANIVQSLKLPAGNIKVLVEGVERARAVTVTDHSLEPETKKNPKADPADPKQIGAGMPGMIVTVAVKVGDQVTRGQKLLSMEAMKMEHTIVAPAAGKVEEFLFDAGDQVAEGAQLLRFAHEAA